MSNRLNSLILKDFGEQYPKLTDTQRLSRVLISKRYTPNYLCFNDFEMTIDNISLKEYTKRCLELLRCSFLFFSINPKKIFKKFAETETAHKRSVSIKSVFKVVSGIFHDSIFCERLLTDVCPCLNKACPLLI